MCDGNVFVNILLYTLYTNDVEILIYGLLVCAG